MAGRPIENERFESAAEKTEVKVLYSGSILEKKK